MKFGLVLTIAALLAFPVIAEERTALRITGTVEEITPHGAFLVNVRVMHRHREEIPTRKGFTPMKSRKRYRAVVKEIPLLDSWRRVFLWGKGSWFYDGQVWSGVVCEDGTYRWREQSLICFKPCR